MKCNSGLQNCPVIGAVVLNPSTDGQAVHRDKVMLLLGGSLIGLTPGILANETIGCLHKGQGMDPGGTNKLVEVLVMEHRYRAHLVQNSWLQPVM